MMVVPNSTCTMDTTMDTGNANRRRLLATTEKTISTFVQEDCAANLGLISLLESSIFDIFTQQNDSFIERFDPLEASAEHSSLEWDNDDVFSGYSVTSEVVKFIDIPVTPKVQRATSLKPENLLSRLAKDGSPHVGDRSTEYSDVLSSDEDDEDSICGDDSGIEDSADESCTHNIDVTSHRVLKHRCGYRKTGIHRGLDLIMSPSTPKTGSCRCIEQNADWLVLSFRQLNNDDSIAEESLQQKSGAAKLDFTHYCDHNVMRADKRVQQPSTQRRSALENSDWVNLSIKQDLSPERKPMFPTALWSICQRTATLISNFVLKDKNECQDAPKNKTSA